MQKKCDHEKIFAMHDEGKSWEEIAKAVGCKETTVYKLLLTAGKISRVNQSRTREYYPIRAEEIDRFRDSLQIGESIWLEEPDLQKGFDDAGRETRRRRMEKCRITEKYKHFFVAVNEKGRVRTARYVDLIKEERKKKHV